MSNTLLKVTDDLWCVWNNTCDSPEAWGTHDEIYAYLDRGERCWHCGKSPVDERFHRAEATGWSMKDEPRPSGFVYDQVGWLPWERLEAFLRSGEDVSTKAKFDESLLDPFDD